MTSRILRFRFIVIAALTLQAVPLTLSAQSSAFNEAVFSSTHNSYAAGDILPLKTQLEAGVRFVELDIYAEDVAKTGDYILGHDGPGKDIKLGGGNPDSPNLSPWLEVIKTWSDQNAGHAPITLLLDVKGAPTGKEVDCATVSGGLTSKTSWQDGNLGFLNDKLESTFGPRLFKAAQLTGPWPSVDELRGRILVVLSGDLCARQEYRWHEGRQPAVAMNAHGQIVLVYESGGGQLGYWTGQHQDDGGIRWHRHGRYDLGVKPAVALSHDGWVVAVHEAEETHALVCQLGRLDADLEIQWIHSFDGVPIDSGLATAPSVAFQPGAGLVIKLTHQATAQPANHWEWTCTLDPAQKTITWSNHAKTDQPVFDRATATAGNRSVTVSSKPDGAAPEQTLCYATSGGITGRIRPEQVAFVEYQKGESDALAKDGCIFAATSSNDKNVKWALEQRQKKHVVRLWKFNTLLPAIETSPLPPANFPATDTPLAPWYVNYCQRFQSVK